MPEMQSNDDRMAAQRARVNTVADMLRDERIVQQLNSALPRGGLNGARLARIVLTEVRRTPKLAECTRDSFLGALMTCAAYGLEPGPQGFCFLIPRKNTQARCMEVNFQIGYKGLLALGWRSNQIQSIQCEPVYVGDHFEYSNGIPPKLEHRPMESDDGSPREWTHVYAIVGTVSGGWVFRVLTKAAVLRVRDKYSEGYKNKPHWSPWTSHEEEMACKTVLVRAFKFAPVSTETISAIALDERSNLGIPQDIGVSDIGLPELASDQPVGLDVDTSTGEVKEPEPAGASNPALENEPPDGFFDEKRQP